MPFTEKTLLAQLEDRPEVDSLDPSLDLGGPRLSEQMSKRLASIKPTPLPKKPSLVDLVEKIPLLTGFLKTVNTAGAALSGLAKLNDNFSNSIQAATSGFQFAGFALNIIDFFRIPALYVASAAAGVKPPITLTNNGTWLYSAVIVALTSTAIALPFTAPAIGLTLAGLTLVTTAATMVKIIIQRNRLHNKLTEVEALIAAETAELDVLQKQAIELESAINVAPTKERKAELTAKLSDISALFDQRYQQLQTHHDNKFKYEEELKEKSLGKLMDKGVGMALTCVAIVGLTLALFFPPVGAIILGASAAAGLAYLAARVGIPFFKGLVSKFSKKNVPEALDDHSEKPLENEKKEALSDTIKHAPTPSHALGSTATALDLLYKHRVSPDGSGGTENEVETLLNASQHDIEPETESVVLQKEKVTTPPSNEPEPEEIKARQLAEESRTAPTPFDQEP